MKRRRPVPWIATLGNSLAAVATVAGLAGALMAASGCGPARYIPASRSAAAAVKKADAAGALQSAPYWHTRAKAYLDKAREEAGNSDYATATRYAKASEQAALRALKITKGAEAAQ